MKQLLASILFFFSFCSFAQEVQINNDKELTALRTQSTIKVDGELDESDWMKAQLGTDFYQRAPNPGTKSTKKTEVRLLYDNTALYLGAVLYEDIDSMSIAFTDRDVINNTDWFGMILCPYQDGINGVGFVTTPKAGQFDTKYSALGEDVGWDAVWDVEVQIKEDRWIVEMKIPFSALRFPENEEQIWSLNFVRNTFNTSENVFWHHIDRKVNGFLNQTGILKGINNIKPPLRLAATPFVAGYLENYSDKNADEPINSWGKSFNAGMDIRYGLSDAFTLDMTLIPDFGEAQSDNQVINLSPFEVRFDENRQFFTEGTELFNKGNIFYSRRAGGNTLYSTDDFLDEGEEVLEDPGITQLYNASKISGRLKRGTGIGFFNAVAGSSQGLIQKTDGTTREVQTNPLTNFNVSVVDQNLKNNSYVTLINTNVLRKGDDYDANVTGVVFDLRNKEQSYSLRGVGRLSQLFFADHDRYASHVEDLPFLRTIDRNGLLSKSDDTNLEGYSYGLEVGKISGNFNIDLSYDMESFTYDINDLGFIRTPNDQSFELRMTYRIFEPFGKFNAMGAGLNTEYTKLHRPSAFNDFGVNAWWWAELNNFWQINFWTYFEPVNEHDYFETRNLERFVLKPTFYNFGTNISTDQRKNVTLNFSGFYGRATDTYEANFGGFDLDLSVFVNQHLSFSLSYNRFKDHNDLGFVDNFGVNDSEIILGLRDVLTQVNGVRAIYTFTKNMNLNFRLRHYWSAVEYNEFHNIGSEGELLSTAYNEFNDLSFNFFNIDLIYRWRFLPGSDIFVIWKNNISDVSDESSLIQYNYRKGFQNLSNFPKGNSLSVKLVYYLDFATLGVTKDYID